MMNWSTALACSHAEGVLLVPDLQWGDACSLIRNLYGIPCRMVLTHSWSGWLERAQHHTAKCRGDAIGLVSTSSGIPLLGTSWKGVPGICRTGAPSLGQLMLMLLHVCSLPFVFCISLDSLGTMRACLVHPRGPVRSTNLAPCHAT